MTIAIQQGDVLQLPCDLLVVHAFEGAAGLIGAAKAVDAAMEGALSDLIKQDGFLGKKGERLVFPTFGKLKARKVAVIGFGPKQGLSVDAVRVMGGTIVRVAREAKAKKVVTILHGVGMAGLDARDAAKGCIWVLIGFMRITEQSLNTHLQGLTSLPFLSLKEIVQRSSPRLLDLSVRR